MAKVSVIIPVYNYGEFLKKAIESVLAQNFEDYELIIVNDGSTDNTSEVLKAYEGMNKIKLITHKKNQGLVRSCHEAIEASTGEYIIRLDADDYFDENALLVLAKVLDSNPEIGLVYPDYLLVSREGKIIDYVRLPKVNEEVKVLDIPANGAGAMFRRSCYEAVGGYDLSLRCQDGYDLWLKFLNRFRVYNVNLPLFYYRRHGSSLTSDNERILRTRRYIKQKFISEELKGPKPKALGIIPARAHDYCDYLAIRKLGNKPLIAYTIEEALKARALDRVVVTTEDEKIAGIAANYSVEVIMRPIELTQLPVEESVLYVLDSLREKDYTPALVAILHVNTPFKKEEHITEAINTLLIYGVDSVVSVCEDLWVHYQHGSYGLTQLFERRLLRQEREALYRENGAIFVSETRVITRENFLGRKIGHIVMTLEESLRIDSEFGFWLAEQIMREGQKWVKLKS